MATPPIINPAADIAAIQEAAEIAGTSTDKFAAVSTQLGIILAKYTAQFGDLLKASIALDAAATAKTTLIYENTVKPFEQASLIPRRLVAELTGASVLGLGEVSVTAKALRDQSYKEQQLMISEQVNVGGTGAQAFILPLVSFYKDASELGAAFIQGALGDSRLYSAGMRALSETNSLETKKISAFTAKAFNLDAEQMRAIYQAEFSKTGKITGDFVEKFSATVLAAEKVTGLSNRALSEDMKRMVTNVEDFGNISEAKMASLSSTMHQLGIDINDVTAVAGKFASFDSATTAISNLSAVTGATLDTMELFYLANEDKEEFFRSLRQQLIDQGVSLENLSHQEQVYLSKQLGFSSVRQLQSLMNEDIELTSENMSEMIESAAQGAEFQGDNLQALLTKTGGFAKDTLAAMEPGALKGSLESIKALAGGTDQFAESIIGVNKKLAELTTKGMPAFGAAGLVFAASVTASMKAVSQSAVSVDDFVKLFQDALAKLTAAAVPITPKSMPPLWAGVLSGLDMFKKEFISTLDSTADGAAAKINTLYTSVTKNMTAAVAASAQSFADIREKSKAEIVEIDKIEKQLAADSKKIGTESDAVIKRFKDYVGFRPEDRDRELQKQFGGGTGQILTNENVTALVAALEKGDLDAGGKVIIDATEALKATALEKFSAEPQVPAPVAPVAPAAAPAAAPPAVAVPPAPAPVPPPAPAPAPAPAAPPPAPVAAAGATGDLAIKVKIDFDMGALKEMINSALVTAAEGGIALTQAVGPRTAGTYRFALERA